MSTELKSNKSNKKLIYKKAEFKAFIKTISEGQVGHWVDIAKAIGVSQETIVEWKKLPEAEAAIQEGIDHALQAMQQAGARDWRMWREKLSMLGVKTEDSPTIQINDPVVIILKQFGLIDARENKETTNNTSQS